MTDAQLKLYQKAERQKCLQEILSSQAKLKLIVAGPGTGKTFTFGKLLQSCTAGNNLAMTFIRRLVGEMESELGTYAEVKTFHAYCKKILHGQNGKVEIAPFLTKLITRDAELLGEDLSNFDSKFQTLEEESPEVMFHVKRGDYYDAVGFDDAVFRLYRLLRHDPDVLPSFSQIVIDEFQDFHSLEVAFIGELSKKGNILIVGDDDQAVYKETRNASPNHLRELYRSPDFKKFELPFCSRCPDVIVRATNAFIDRAQKAGHLRDRIPKKYDCYIEDKERDSIKYPNIISASCSTGAMVAKYVRAEISKIDSDDIAESHEKNYLTVLVIGTKQYLNIIDKALRKAGVACSYTPSEEIGYNAIDGYKWMLRDENSNLAWRIIVEIFLDESELRRVVEQSELGTEIRKLLDSKFVENHLRATVLIRRLQDGQETLAAIAGELKNILGLHFQDVTVHFSPKDAEESVAIDKTKPTVLLTSFVGCKGLSAGHVFIVGAHNGSMPRISGSISDVEISQFIVALTRTRKQCHVVGNDWLFAPVDKQKNRIPKFKESAFRSWIPSELLEDKGKLSAKTLK